MVAAAIVGTGIAGVVGSGIAGHEAAGATQNATSASIAEQNSALSQQASLSAPYRGVGSDAIGTYEGLLGIGKGGAQNPATMDATLSQMPGYQFALDQGQKGVLNAASLGGGVGGNTLQALDTFNQGLASTTYRQNLGDVQQAVGLGQAAAAGQAQNVGQAAGNISSSLINQGQTTAGIDANTVAGITKSLGNASDQYAESQTLAALGKQSGGLYSGGGTTTGSDGYTTNNP